MRRLVQLRWFWRCAVAGLALMPMTAALMMSAAGAPAAPGPTGDATVTFRKIFKSSYPEFVEIKVAESGDGMFDIRQLSDDPNPLPFRVEAPLVHKIFDLARQLHDFDGISLDMRRRIANLGQKTFSYQSGSEAHSVTFNYTDDHAAQDLLDIFEGLSRQQSDISELQRTMRYDRLGVNDVLHQIEKDYDRKLLPEPSQLLASLDQLAADSRYVDIARQQARQLAGRIRSSE
jgi:hypothetical protein